MNQLNFSELYSTISPDGQSIRIPFAVDPVSDVYSQLTTLDQQKKYYDENGYVVARNLIPVNLCDEVVNAFNSEVKPYKGYIYRQTSSLPEKHNFSESGHILNSIKHIQDMNRRAFPEFIERSFASLAYEQVSRVVKHFLNDESIIVQTMFFDGNPSTPPHYDSYYLDSAEIGSMVAIWVALEDIQPGAGRFFVYPGSHKLELPKNEGLYEITEHHKQYLGAINGMIALPRMECRAPAMRKGDVLFWNALTIHGSLQTTQPQYSRKSLTAHFIPASKDYVLFQKAKVNLNIKNFQGLSIHSPKDQEQVLNQLQMFGLTYFPNLTNKLRNAIIRMKMR